MSYSVGKAIREINSNKISHSYFLSGNDYFLQNFFIKRLTLKLNDISSARYLNFEEETDQKLLLNELENLSLFSNKGLYVIRNFNKISPNLKNTIIQYIRKPNSDNIMIFVSDDFYSKNKFLTSISNQSFSIDTRTPFPNKIREWVNYYIKTQGLNIESPIIDELIDSFNDSISTIVNEIEKLYLFNNNPNIKYKNFYKISEKYQNIRPWNLIDSVGSKNITNSIEQLDILFMNGSNVIPLVINLSNFFKAILLYNVSSDYTLEYNGLNKIINNKLKTYSSNFSIEEIINIFISLKNVDVLSKSTSLNHRDMLFLLIVKICKGFYAK